MPELVSRSPLQGAHVHGAAAHSAGVVLEELRGGAVISLRGLRRDAAAARKAGAIVSASVPQTPNRAIEERGMWIAWREPGAWAVMTTMERRDEILNAAQAARDILATDLSAATFIVRISGAEARRLLMSGCPLDLDALGKGDCGASLFGAIPVHILCTSEAPAFLVACERALAHALWRDLVDAAQWIGEGPSGAGGGLGAG